MYEVRNSDKINELTSDRGWGDHEDDADFEPRRVDIDPDDTDIPDQDEDFEEPESALADDDDDDGVAEDDDDDYDEALEAVRRESEGRLRALVAERNQRSSTNAQLAEVREELQRLNLAKDSQEGPPPPSKDDDAVGYLEDRYRETADELRNEIGAIRQTMEGERLREDVLEVARASAYYEDEFRQEHEDYDEAFDFVKNTYVDGFLAQGFSPQQAEAQALQAGYQYSRQAMMQGQNPAEIFYGEAQRLGFRVRPGTQRNINPKSVRGSQRESLSQPAYAGAGNHPDQRKGKIDRQWVFDNLNKGQRAKLFTNYALNKQLAETGEVTIPEGFFDS